jgi:autotransporter-associated beta strand protein
MKTKWLIKKMIKHYMRRMVQKPGKGIPMMGVFTAVSLLALFPFRSYGIWAGASTGNGNDAAHAYLTAGNWAASTIDDSFAGFTLTGATVLYLNDNRTTTAGLNTSFTGNQNLTLQGTGADRTLTLGGDITHQAPTATGVPSLTIGANTAGSRLAIDLGGATRTIWAGTGALARDIRIRDGIFGSGGLVKDGLGSLELQANVASTFSGTVQVNAGTLSLGGENALGANAGNVTVSSGATLSLGGNYLAAHSLTRTFTLNSATLAVTGGTSQFGSILAGSGITKTGTGRLQLNNAGNTFSGGMTVAAGTLSLNAAGVGGQNVAGNDITANGGNIVINAAGTIGGNQTFKVNTSTALSGIGVGANLDLPAFTQIGSGPGVIVVDWFNGTYARADGTDAQVTTLRNAGWFLGSANGGTYAGASLAAATDGIYRLGGGGGTLTINNAVLTGANSLIIGSVLANGGGTVQLNAANGYTGATTINAGALQLTSATSTILGTTSILVAPGPLNTATLQSTGLADGTNNRLGNSTPIILSSGSYVAYFRQAMVASIDAIEDIGAIILRSGRPLIIQGHDASSQLSNAFLRCNADGLTRENRSLAFFSTQRTTAETTSYNNPSFGVRRDAPGSNASDAGNQVFFDSAPTTIGGGARATAKAVIPFLQTLDTTAGSGVPNTLLTYNATEGLRALRIQTDIAGNTSEYVTSVALADADGLDNVRTTAGETVSASKTVNALILTSGSTTIAANTTLSVGSGVIMFKNGTLAASDQVTSVVNFGANEGLLFHIDGSVTTVYPALAGSGGLTIFGNPFITGKNTYTGQTTVISGTPAVYRTTGSAANANDSLPDNGLVLIHPGATLQAGSNNSSYQTQEVVSDLAGSGTITLGNIGNTTVAKRSALIIGNGGTGAVGEVTLDGGTIAPGMVDSDKVGTLKVTVDAAASAAIPVTLKKGTLKIDLAGASPSNDKLAVTGTATITAGGTLSIDVNVSGFTPTVGQQWTILTASSVTDGNGGTLVDQITDNSDRVKFTATIVGGNSVVLTAEDERKGTLIRFM